MRTSSDACRRSVHLVFAAAVLVLLACASAGTAAQAASSGDGLVVTVMIYSGRPNPSFTLDDAALIDQLRTAVASAAPKEDVEGDTVVPSILGYNGVRVENRSGVEGVPRTLLLYDGAIEVHDGGTRFLADPDRTLERSLVDQARDHGLFRDDPRALDMIREAIGGDNGTVY